MLRDERLGCNSMRGKLGDYGSSYHGSSEDLLTSRDLLDELRGSTRSRCIANADNELVLELDSFSGQSPNSSTYQI